MYKVSKIYIHLRRNLRVGGVLYLFIEDCFASIS